MRILVQMPFPGYLRMYGSTIRELAERGHRVLLSYDDADKRRDASAAAVEAHAGIELVEPLPRAKRTHEARITKLRIAIDYLRYLDARFADAPYLRRRLEKNLDGPALRLLARAPARLPLANAGVRALLAVERLVPSDARVERALAALAPDVVFVTPLIGRSNRNRRQTDTVKAARRLRIPVAAGVATWDHLTTKGVIKALPDRVLVWNEIQRRDAMRFHFVPPERVVVTGAQLFDGWFERGPSASRSEFLRGVGLGDRARVVCYVGSSPNIAPPELEVPFVRRWIAALRSSRDPRLAELGVLVRPHPYNVEAWAEADVREAGVAVAPRVPPELPMTEEDKTLYYDSLHFSSAVVGINTTSMVEAFVQRRPVLTIRSPEFRETQEGTLHFGNLRTAAGDALQAGATLDEHLRQLGAVFDRPDGFRDEIEAFLRVFVRPHGLEIPATPLVADELERLAASRERLVSRRAPARAGAAGETTATSV